MSSGMTFLGGRSAGKNLEPSNILENFRAVYLAGLSPDDSNGAYAAWLGSNWREGLDSETHQVAGHPGVFIGEEFSMDGVTVVAAAACGRTVAAAIDQFLSTQ